jgi:hypothetical protein
LLASEGFNFRPVTAPQQVEFSIAAGCRYMKRRCQMFSDGPKAATAEAQAGGGVHIPIRPFHL